MAQFPYHLLLHHFLLMELSSVLNTRETPWRLLNLPNNEKVLLYLQILTLIVHFFIMASLYPPYQRNSTLRTN